MFNYIIFHKGCIDGYAGFIIAHLSNKLSAGTFIYQDVPSTNKVPPNIDNKNIIIIDVAYRSDILEEIFKHAHQVVFVDHHVSIHNDVTLLHKKYNTKDNICIIYNSNKSGCTLTWDYFNDTNPPLFLQLIEDNDIGKWEYPETKPFIYALKSYYRLNTDTKNIDAWCGLLAEENVNRLIKKGKIISLFNEHLIEVNLQKHSRERFPSKKVYNMDKTLFDKVGQYIVVVFNGVACPSITDLANTALSKIDCDFFIAWTYNLDKRDYVVSMRSKSVDVGKIAQLFGGGGHKLAAAFAVSDSKLTIQDMFEGSSLPRHPI